MGDGFAGTLTDDCGEDSSPAAPWPEVMNEFRDSSPPCCALASPSRSRAIVAQTLAAAVRKSGLKVEGINLLSADGEAAGQEVFHVHLHVLPRFRGDGFGRRVPPHYGQHTVSRTTRCGCESDRKGIRYPNRGSTVVYRGSTTNFLLRLIEGAISPVKVARRMHSLDRRSA